MVRQIIWFNSSKCGKILRKCDKFTNIPTWFYQVINAKKMRTNVALLKKKLLMVEGNLQLSKKSMLFGIG